MNEILSDRCKIEKCAMELKKVHREDLTIERSQGSLHGNKDDI